MDTKLTKKKRNRSMLSLGDDVKAYNHWRHVHFYLRGEPNWDAEMITI